MITLTIPGFNIDALKIQHLLLDFNGTLAIDGKLIEGVKETLNALSEILTIHVLTGNTFKTAEEELKDIRCNIVLLPSEDQGTEKGKYIQKLEPNTVISIGNGRNDKQMLQLAAIGIIVIQKEGTAIDTLACANVACTNILEALDLLNNPLRLTATLRS